MIKRMIFLLYLYIIIANYSCSIGSKMDCGINYIDPNYENYNSILDDGKKNFIFGTDGDSQDYRTKETVIYKRTFDGDFVLTTRVKGQTQTATFFGKYIYLINEVFTKKLSFSDSKSILYKLNTETNEIEKVAEMGNILIKDIIFESDSAGYLSVRFSNYASDGGFLKTIDGGVSWDTLKLGKPIDKVQSLKDKLYFLSYKKNDKTDWIYSIEKESNKLDSLQVDLNITDFVVGENGDYWLLGQDGDRTELQYYEDGKARVIKTFSEGSDFFPKQLYKYKDVIVVLTSKIDKSMLGGFGGTKPVMYISKDNGLTWDIPSLDEELLYLKPVSFYKDERMTAYVGRGKVLTCSLK